MQKYQNAIQDVHGNAVASATVTVYLYGTLTPAVIYSDNGLTVIPSSQVTTDSDGQFYFYADNGRYTLSVMATGFAQEQFSDVSLFDQADAGIASVKDYGAVGDGVTDDTAAINAAIAALNALSFDALLFPAGRYIISSALTTITRSRVAVYGQGPRQSFIKQTANANTLTFASSTPSSSRISDVTVRNLGFDQGNVTNPTAGISLLVTRADRAYFDNIDIRNCFQGIVIEGGADQHWSNLTVTGSTSFTGLAAGSNLLEIKNYAGTTEVPSEIFFNNFNIKGYGVYGGSHYHAACIIIRCGDGIFFDTGHCGFTYNSLCYINPQDNAALSCLNLEFSNVYFDGNNAGNTSNSAFWLDGSITPTVRHIKLDGCTVKNFKGNGVNVGLSTCRDVRINNSLISDNGNNGAVFTGVDEIAFSGNTIRGRTRRELDAELDVVDAGVVYHDAGGGRPTLYAERQVRGVERDGVRSVGRRCRLVSRVVERAVVQPLLLRHGGHEVQTLNLVLQVVDVGVRSDQGRPQLQVFHGDLAGTATRDVVQVHEEPVPLTRHQPRALVDEVNTRGRYLGDVRRVLSHWCRLSQVQHP